MKRLNNIFTLVPSILGMVSLLFVSCTDIDGDGVGTVDYNGSTLPQNTSYRNPVWEPDFELGTIFKGASTYIAIASETEWAAGLPYCGPIITSTNLMDWNKYTNTAFPYVTDTVISGTDTIIYKRPDWASGRLHSMAAGFTKTIPGTSYWLFYQLGDEPAIGVATGRSGQGPYSDFGKLLGTENTGSQSITDPFFFIKGTNTYLLYSTENGSYLQQLTMKRNAIPTLKNAAIQLTGSTMSDVAIYFKNDFYYLFGTVMVNGQSEIHYGRSENINGPFVDANGTDLMSGTGTTLIQGGTQLIDPNNVCGVFTDYNEDDFLLYNVTDATKPLMASGYNRRPLVMHKLEINEEGWITNTIQPAVGWTTPKFIDKE